MRLRRCGREDAIRVASASGRWTPALTLHASICSVCGDVKTVTEALASPLGRQARAVNPVILWARARQAAELAAARRMARILMAGQILAASVVVLVLISATVLVVLSGSQEDPSTTTASSTAEIALIAGVFLTGATLWLSRWAARF